MFENKGNGTHRCVNWARVTGGCGKRKLSLGDWLRLQCDQGSTIVKRLNANKVYNSPDKPVDMTVTKYMEHDEARVNTTSKTR